MTLNQLLVINISLYIVSNMNARYARVSPISPSISDIRYEKPPSDTIPISDIENPAPTSIHLTPLTFGHQIGTLLILEKKDCYRFWSISLKRICALAVDIGPVLVQRAKQDYMSVMVFSQSYASPLNVLTRVVSGKGYLVHFSILWYLVPLVFLMSVFFL